jgi:hypothetical protein
MSNNHRGIREVGKSLKVGNGGERVEKNPLAEGGRRGTFIATNTHTQNMIILRSLTPENLA